MVAVALAQDAVRRILARKFYLFLLVHEYAGGCVVSCPFACAGRGVSTSECVSMLDSVAVQACI